MDDRRSFRRQKDVLRLIAAVLTPWLLLAISIAPAWCSVYCTGMGRRPWIGIYVTMWFYLVSIAAMFVGVGLFLLGVWRVVWYRAYRRSVYGWVWPLLMWVSTGGLGPALGGLRLVAPNQSLQRLLLGNKSGASKEVRSSTSDNCWKWV